MPDNALERTLPDPLDSVCGWCRREVALTRISPAHEVRARDSGPGGERTFLMSATYLCPRPECNRPSLVFVDVIYKSSLASYGSDYRFDAVVGALPAGSAKAIEGLSDEIESDRQEAWRSFYAGNLRAAIIMGRAAIQRAARNLGATAGGLRAEINDLLRKGVITKALKDFADEVRIAGDDAAHPEDLGAVTREDAQTSLDFMDEFLEHAIAFPARREALKAARKQS